VAIASRALHGRQMASAVPTKAASRRPPSKSAARWIRSVQPIAEATATARATSRLRPSSAIAAPWIQNGSGSQLVPLGSSFGVWTSSWAMTTRA
jgi:hypothetical protein